MFGRKKIIVFIARTTKIREDLKNERKSSFESIQLQKVQEDDMTCYQYLGSLVTKS